MGGRNELKYFWAPVVYEKLMCLNKYPTKQDRNHTFNGFHNDLVK